MQRSNVHKLEFEQDFCIQGYWYLAIALCGTLLAAKDSFVSQSVM